MAVLSAQTQGNGKFPNFSSYDEFVAEFLGFEFSYLESYFEVRPDLKSEIIVCVDIDGFVIALGYGKYFNRFNVPKESIQSIFPTTPIRHFDKTGDCDYKYYLTEQIVF